MGTVTTDLPVMLVVVLRVCMGLVWAPKAATTLDPATILHPGTAGLLQVLPHPTVTVLEDIDSK